MKKKKTVLIYRIILAILIVFGILLNYIAKNCNLNLLLSYYTIQSNLLLLLFLVFQIINYYKPLSFFKDIKNYQNIKGMITLIILITGLIFIVILLPYTTSWNGFRLYSSYILHYISPGMMLIDWLFFDKSEFKLTKISILKWFIYPFIYYTFGIIRILFIDGFIPYPFMNVNSLGLIKSLSIFLLLLIIFYILSILLIKLKNKISKI